MGKEEKERGKERAKKKKRRRRKRKGGEKKEKREGGKKKEKKEKEKGEGRKKKRKGRKGKERLYLCPAAERSQRSVPAGSGPLGQQAPLRGQRKRKVLNLARERRPEGLDARPGIEGAKIMKKLKN